MRLVLRVRLPGLLAPLLMRRLRSLVRLLELRCCLVEAASRRRRVLQEMGLGRRVDQQRRRQVLQERPWSEAVDHLRRWELLQLRRLVLRVRAHRRLRRQQARRLGLLWLITVDRHLRRLVQPAQRPRVLEHLWSRQLRSPERLLELLWCTQEAASRRQ